LGNVFSAGPLSIKLVAEDIRQYEDAASFLGRYDVVWKNPCVSVTVCVSRSADCAKRVEGNFLNLSRMNVDSRPPGLYASCTSGCYATYSAEQSRWDIFVPPSQGRALWEIPNDIEDLLMLVLTTGWRAAGWVPIHAGAISRDETCALVCATSGGGKTTLVSAMVREGWLTLGDDKLLLRSTSEGPVVRAVSHIFHLDPLIGKWFPEVHDLDRYPAVSPLSQKRRVPVGNLWSGNVASEARPTHLVMVRRPQREGVMRIAPLGGRDLLSTILGQIVIPKDRDEGNFILTTAADTSRHVKGLEVEIDGSAYLRPNGLLPLKEALR
jgi:hypothetical protein